MTARIPTVALTGGIASGKSAVAAEFAKLGVPVIDADEIARTVVEPNQPALRAIVEHFGKRILDRHGNLDRKQLRERIFSNPADKKILEDILHPLIRAEQQRRATTAGGVYQLHVIPLLAETGGQHLYDRVLVVDCSRDLQLQRLVTRDGIAPDLAERMIAGQATREQRMAIADNTIDNSTDRELLTTRVAALHQTYLKDLASQS